MRTLTKKILLPIVSVVPSLLFAGNWGITTETVIDQTNGSWLGITQTENINVTTGGSLIFEATANHEKTLKSILLTSATPTTAYFGVEDSAYDAGDRLTLNIQSIEAKGAASTLTFGKGTTVNISNAKNGTWGSAGASLVFDGATVNIQYAATYVLNIVNAANDSASVYFKNGATFESSTTDPTKTVQLYSGRGENASTSFYVQSGSKVSVANLTQDANSGSVLYEVSGKNSVFSVTAKEFGTTETFKNSNRGASVGHWGYTGTEKTILRVADGGKFVANGCSQNSNFHLYSGLKIMKNGVLQLAPTSANNAREAGGSAMVEATAINFQQGGKLELDLSGLTAMSEEFKTDGNVFTFDLMEIAYNEELGQIFDIYKDTVYTGEASGTEGVKLELGADSAAIEEFLAGLINEDYLSTINGEYWNAESFEWFYSDEGDGKVLGFTMEYIGQYVPVPEPGTYAAVFGAFALLVAACRRRKRLLV